MKTEADGWQWSKEERIGSPCTLGRKKHPVAGEVGWMAADAGIW